MLEDVRPSRTDDIANSAKGDATQRRKIQRLGNGKAMFLVIARLTFKKWQAGFRTPPVLVIPKQGWCSCTKRHQGLVTNTEDGSTVFTEGGSTVFPEARLLCLRHFMVPESEERRNFNITLDWKINKCNNRAE